MRCLPQEIFQPKFYHPRIDIDQLLMKGNQNQVYKSNKVIRHIFSKLDDKSFLLEFFQLITCLTFHSHHRHKKMFVLMSVYPYDNGWYHQPKERQDDSWFFLLRK